jgi:hypothetical protein
MLVAYDATAIWSASGGPRGSSGTVPVGRPAECVPAGTVQAKHDICDHDPAPGVLRHASDPQRRGSVPPERRVFESEGSNSRIVSIDGHRLRKVEHTIARRTQAVGRGDHPQE